MSLRSIIFLVLIVGGISSAASECDPKYSKLTPEHTMCAEPKSDCEVIKKGLNDDDKQKLLQLHNEIRSKLATGKEGFPEAADMQEMVWDEEIAKVAQRHTELCINGHDCDDCRKVEPDESVGQNIAGKTSQEKDLDGLMQQLYGEKAAFRNNQIDRLSDSTGIGHYSQLIWSKSYKVGCGWTYYKSGSEKWSKLVCNYVKIGNVMGGMVYKRGAACSACPAKTCCGKTCEGSNKKSKYEGLCSMIEK